jgi:hypothetical protein
VQSIESNDKNQIVFGLVFVMRSAGAAMCEFVPRTGGDFGFIVIFDL